MFSISCRSTIRLYNNTSCSRNGSNRAGSRLVDRLSRNNGNCTYAASCWKRIIDIPSSSGVRSSSSLSLAGSVSVYSTRLVQPKTTRVVTKQLIASSSRRNIHPRHHQQQYQQRWKRSSQNQQEQDSLKLGTASSTGLSQSGTASLSISSISSESSSSSSNLASAMQNLFIGICAASYWRGAWYVMEDNVYPDDPVLSAAVSMLIGSIGIITSQSLLNTISSLTTTKRALVSSTKTSLSHWHDKLRMYLLQSPIRIKTVQFAAIYVIAISSVFVWRGTWLGWDLLYTYTHSTATATTTTSSSSSSSFTTKSTRSNDDEDDDIFFSTGRVDDAAHPHLSRIVNGSFKDDADVLEFTKESDNLDQISVTKRSGFEGHDGVDGDSSALVKATDPGHATISGMASHVIAILAMVSLGVFSSVFAPPIAMCILNDKSIYRSIVRKQVQRVQRKKRKQQQQQKALLLQQNNIRQQRALTSSTTSVQPVSFRSHHQLVTSVPSKQRYNYEQPKNNRRGRSLK